MARLDEVLAAAEMQGLVTVVAGTTGDREVRGADIIEDISRVDGSGEDRLVVLTESASQRVEPYRLDIALRVGLHRGVAAIAFVGPNAPNVSRTGRELSARGAPAVVHSQAPIAQLLIGITHVIERSAGGQIRSLNRLVDAIEDAQTTNVAVPMLLQKAREATGLDIQTEPPDGEVIAVDVVVDGRREASLSVSLTGDGVEDYSRRIAVHLVADGVGRLLSEASRAEHLPMLSHSELLTELLIAPEAQSEPLLRRARALGITVDGWHIVTRIQLDNLLTVVSGDEIGAYELRQDFAKRLLQELRGGAGSWHHARSNQDLLFIHSDRRDPGLHAARSVARAVDAALDRTLGHSRLPLTIRCGIGSVHAGPQGLRGSALESRASMAQARLHGVSNRAVVFDASGVRRGLVEWYTSDAARESAKLLLAPLEQLDSHARDRAIRTLAAYLDAGGSLARAAQKLHIHRNAVAYRVKRSIDRLEVALDDPEQRLMLHLACRAELLSVGSDQLG